MPAATALRLALGRLAEGSSLSREETRAAFGVVMAGEATPAELGALLLGLRSRGESADELAGAVEALRAAMRTVTLPASLEVVDTCGTGGGRVGTVNISTAAALVTAAAGIPVAKHGNRSFTSRSGSADVLEALGVPVDQPPEEAARIFAEAGLVFLFAPTYHPAMRHAAPVRRDLGVATILNLVGPLANPAGVSRQVVGVSDARHGDLVAGALARLGTERALVVHARIGMDEIAPVGETDVWEVRGGEVGRWLLDPRDVDLAVPSLVGTEGGDPAENADVIARLLESSRQAAPALRAAVILNAAAAILVSGREADFASAAARAAAALDAGEAHDRLARLRTAVARTSG